MTEEKHINKENKHRRYTLCFYKRCQVKVGLHKPKMSAELSKGELKTCFASRRNERDMASIKKASDGMVEIVQFTEEKKEGAVDCALENRSVFTSTVDQSLISREALKGKIRHTECPQNSII